ncbi:septal ring lytic transglycosylase RlpA family protein [Roseibium algae]|uniref:Endolytic peptidoglycan transglycosylase RlpA n=1 Tax=Roseibium algae TaxID=3123038 RepID=A0ABU8TLP4_9HYPH
MTSFVLMTYLCAGTSAAMALTQCGKASWYALTSQTASGEMADPTSFNAAHRTLPFGTKVKVTNLHNGRTTIVSVNDRGPFVKGRIIDVTRAAAKELKFLDRGVTRVKIEIADRNYPRSYKELKHCKN